MSFGGWELSPDGAVVQRSDGPDPPPPPAPNPFLSSSSWSSSSASSAASSASASSSSSTGPLLPLHVSFGPHHHQVSISSQASFGELKVILAPLTGLNPQDQRLLFNGREREDNELLHIAGVDGKSRVIVVEDPASKERKFEEMRRNECISRACHAVSLIRQEVDKLAEQVGSLEMAVNSRDKVEEKQFFLLSELLMRDLLKLDNVEAEGEAKVQRKIEVKRVQGLIDKIDSLKVQSSTPLWHNNVVVTTEWESFDSGISGLPAPPPMAPSNVTTNWERFD